MNENWPVHAQHVMDVETGPLRLKVGSFGQTDVAASEHARLDFMLEGRLSFAFPATMTEAEARNTFLELTARLEARNQCHLVIDSVPADVIPAILPQLRDMAEYEVRMWQVRQEVEATT